MRYLLAIAVLLTAAAAVAAPSTGYVDSLRVRTTATAPRRADADFAADQGGRDQQLQAATEAARKAKQAEQRALWDKARELKTTNDDAVQKHADQVNGDFDKTLGELAEKLRTDRHLTQIVAGPGVRVIPGVDLTDEVIRRWNALDAEGLAADNARLKAENAALKKPSPAAKP